MLFIKLICYTSRKVWPSAELLGLWSQNCLKDMSFRMTCLTGACLKGGHALLEGMSYGRTRLQDGISYRMRHVLQEDRSYIQDGTSYRRTGLLEDMYYRRLCIPYRWE